MEVLGFIETPGTAIDSTLTWVATPVEVHDPVADTPHPASDLLAGWRPQEIGARLLTGRVRWGMVASVVLLLALTAFAALWVYRRPAIEAARAREQVVSAAATLTPDLARFETLSRSLASSEIDAVEVNSVMLAVDSGVRRLFEATAGLPSAEVSARATLVSVTGDVADVLRRFGDAYTFRTAVIPILAPPALLTDPSLTTLEEAATTFTAWQATFESVRTSLPEGTFPEVTSALAVLSANLTGHHRLYLDSLSDGDTETAAAVVGRIQDDLDDIELILFTSLADARNRIAAAVQDALSTLRGVESLLG